MHGLGVNMAVQHKLGAVLLEDAREFVSVAKAAMPAGLVAQGRVVDQHDAKQPLAAKLIERVGEKLALKRADLSCGDEGHSGNGG